MKMELCTNNGIEHGQILDSVAHSVKLIQDVFIIATTECELVNEVIVTSEEEDQQDTIILNNSVLPGEINIPAVTPKMPQQSGPRNATHEDAAGLPVATPSFVIPPHLMGRNIDNPVEDMIGSGRKLQKPRLGVRVPYRNLTSQIVTQDEIAKELLERSLKKHPVHDTPGGGDLFFAMKLTQRLANRLTPSSTVVSGSTISEMEATGSKSAHYQQSSDSTLLPSRYAIVPQSTAIPDHGELLAILEDGDSGWVPEANSTVAERKTLLAEASKPPSLTEAGPSSENAAVHSGPAKLDPLVEREMALKQLMELPIRAKKKKPTNAQEKTAKSSKSKERAKKETNSTNKKITKASNSNIVQGATDQATRNPTVQQDDTSAKQKTVLKRKLSDSGSVVSKRSHTARKKEQVSKQSPKEGSLNANNKTDVKRLKQTKIMEAFKRPSIGEKSSGTSVNSSNLDHNKMEASSPKRKKLTNICNSKDITSLNDVNQETASLTDSQGLSVSTDLCDGKSDDDFPAINARKFATPPRTYSPRKRQPKPEGTVSSKEIRLNMVPQTGVSLSSITLPDISQVPAVSKSASNINIDDDFLTKDFGNIVHTFSREDGEPPLCSSTSVTPTKKSSTVSELSSNDAALLDAAAKKRHSRRMGEIDRLLMDEGAINLLYEVEQKDSKRRSGLNGSTESAATTQRKKIRSPLKSVRRQKKDLLLKTRLVKNAVLRLSSAPTPPVSLALRLRRQIGPPQLQLAMQHNHDSLPQHRKSVDSKESLRSPPPLTPVDPPSPAQTFAFPPRLHLPAEASRIIRRHSSSSTFSSRSTSPNVQNRSSVDSIQSPDNAENKPDNHHASNNQVNSNSKTSAEVDKKRPVARKKGVPIFVRKEEIQTYKGKKKKDRADGIGENAERLLEIKCKELKINKSQEVGKKTNLKKSSTASLQNSQRKANSSEKLKLKTQISKNVQKGSQKNKHNKVKKSGQENTLSKQKKKEEREKSHAVDKLLNEFVPDLPSCLAAVATAFAAEGESLKRLTQLRRGSNDSSHSSSHGSRSSTSTQLPASVRKESKDAPPLSPNASSYSTLIKTLETESQKQKKKEGEETAKQRSSVRQNAGSYHYKDIWLRRYDNLVQIILAPASTKMKNALNIQVLRELREALQQLKRDDSCRVVLLTSAGSVFCQGIDFHCLLHSNADRRKTAAQELALALREFLKTLALFSKPIVAGVHGAAVGLGVTMLPFFDMVIASDKATFYTPYAKLGQVPEGAAILTLPHMLGNAVTSELLFGCRKLTASEALHFGLVTRILWPDRFLEELIPLIRSIANQSAQSMEATKALLRHNLRTKLDAALESEAHLLVQHWSSMECQTSFRRFLDDEDVGLQRQRLDP